MPEGQPPEQRPTTPDAVALGAVPFAAVPMEEVMRSDGRFFGQEAHISETAVQRQQAQRRSGGPSGSMAHTDVAYSSKYRGSRQGADARYWNRTGRTDQTGQWLALKAKPGK